ncbi:hypothetical protein Q7P35_010890 [Cladosporium inversicolor]
MPLLPIPTTAPMSMQQAMASTTCVLQVPRTASTASAAHTLRYPARDETSKATPSAAELEMMIRPGYCRHRRQRACPAEVPYCCTSLAHIVHVRLRPRPETTRHDTTRSGAAVRLDKSQPPGQGGSGKKWEQPLHRVFFPWPASLPGAMHVNSSTATLNPQQS